MIEFYINPNNVKEYSFFKKRAKDFNFYQVADPEEFKKQNKKNLIKFNDNFYHKDFNLIAN
jgi:hypothetical protein